MKHLPGLQVIKADVFSLEVGTKVYDKASNTMGVIESIRETRSECIEAFILLDGETEAVQAYKLPQAVIVGGN